MYSSVYSLSTNAFLFYNGLKVKTFTHSSYWLLLAVACSLTFIQFQPTILVPLKENQIHCAYSEGSSLVSCIWFIPAMKSRKLV